MVRRSYAFVRPLAAGQLVERFSLKAFVECCRLVDEDVAGTKDVDLGMMTGAGIVPGPLGRQPKVPAS